MLLPVSFWVDDVWGCGDSDNGDDISTRVDFFIEIGGILLLMFGCGSWGNEYGVVVL